jgi:hypothetical protein
MAPVEARTTDQVRREIDVEREQLATAVGTFRDEIGFASRLRTRLPLAAAGALAAGFVVAGGLGATVRLFFRRGRER